jgi:hypothetical protein
MKTNLYLSPKFGSTYSREDSQDSAVGRKLQEAQKGVFVASRTSKSASSGVLLRARYHVQPDGRAEVTLSVDPIALGRKVALREAQGEFDPSSSTTTDSLFSSLR